MIEFMCRGCGDHFKVSDDKCAGQVKCPICGDTATAPAKMTPSVSCDALAAPQDVDSHIVGLLKGMQGLYVSQTDSQALEKLEAAVEGLTDAGEAAVPTLVKLMKSGGASRILRRWAAWGLGILGKEAAGALADLKTVAHDMTCPPELRDMAMQSLSMIDKGTAMPVLAGILDRDLDRPLHAAADSLGGVSTAKDARMTKVVMLAIGALLVLAVAMVLRGCTSSLVG